MNRFLAVGAVAVLTLFAVPWGFVMPAASRSRHIRPKGYQATTTSSSCNAADTHAAITRVLTGLAVGLLLGASSVSATPSAESNEASRPDCTSRPQAPSALQEFVKASSVRRSERRLKAIQKQLKEHGRLAIDRLCLEEGRSM